MGAKRLGGETSMVRNVLEPISVGIIGMHELSAPPTFLAFLRIEKTIKLLLDRHQLVDFSFEHTSRYFSVWIIGNKRE